MRPRADVWLAGQTAGQLTPPPKSIIDGSEVSSVVRTCCLRREGPSRLEVSLSVDEATAKRFALTCRIEAIWKRKVFPAILVAATLIIFAHVIDSVRNESRFLGTTLLITLILAFTVSACRLVLNLLRSRHHPKLVKGSVLIRDVDRDTAEIWASLNPMGAIEVVGSTAKARAA